MKEYFALRPLADASVLFRLIGVKGSEEERRGEVEREAGLYPRNPFRISSIIIIDEIECIWGQYGEDGKVGISGKIFPKSFSPPLPLQPRTARRYKSA
jgi:hypothetical protein